MSNYYTLTDTSKVEAEIDRLVYDLYDLTDEEIKFFKGSEGDLEKNMTNLLINFILWN